MIAPNPHVFDGALKLVASNLSVQDGSGPQVRDSKTETPHGFRWKLVEFAFLSNVLLTRQKTLFLDSLLRTWFKTTLAWSPHNVTEPMLGPYFG